jgi:hypothetical protein
MSPPEIGNLRGLQTNATDIPDDFNITDSNITIAEASKKDEGDPDSACCAGKENLKSLTFELTGGNCDASSNDQGRKFECYGDFPTSSSFTVKLYEAKFESDGQEGSFSPGDTFTIVPDGSRFASDVEITIGGKQELTIHTSCSQPLNLGDIFGGVTLVDYNGGERTKDCQVFCRNTARAGQGPDENCPITFPACIAPEDEAGEKCCVCQNTAGPFGTDEGCGGPTRPRLCFDGDKEPCFLEGGTQCLCIDDAKGGSRDSGCGNLIPLCGRLATNSDDSKFGEEASFPNVQGNLGNGCFKCQKTTEFPTATDPDANCDENAPRCVDADDGELEDVGQLGFSCTTCQDVFYRKVTLTGAKNYDDAVNSAPDGCILTPIADTTELEAVDNAAGSIQCWVGIVTKVDPDTKPTRLDRANNFKNPESKKGVPVDPYPTITTANIDVFWISASNEPNNSPSPQTTATINFNNSGKLRDVRATETINCAIYKCCGAEK